MNLTLFFRLILMSIFQTSVTFDKKNYGDKMNYSNQSFYCPVIYAKDGFSISLQIHRSAYCSSEKGYRNLGHTMEEVEFGFPSEDDILLHQYSEMYGSEDWDNGFTNNNKTNFNAMGTVGRIPISVLEELFEKREGIDWEKTISIEAFEKAIRTD